MATRAPRRGEGPRLSFFVPGTPKPKGSPRPIRNKWTGKTAMVIDSDAARDWGVAITGEARQALQNRPGYAKGVPVGVDLRYVFRRLTGHFYGVSRKRPEPELRPDAPLFHTTSPDPDKLTRVVLDALTHAGVWHDDAQAVLGPQPKVYGDHPGVHVRVYPIAGPITVAELDQVIITAAHRAQHEVAEEDAFG
jgi:crossover junction endodeoxyribonuclease RusA